jgi:hypothetical protein
MHANPDALYSTMTHLNVKHATLVTTNQPFLYQLMLLVPPVKRDCTFRTQQLIVSITTVLMIASHVQLAVSSPKLPLSAKYVQEVTSKALSQQMERNVHHALPVDLLPMIVKILLTMIQSKNASSVPLEHTVLPGKCPVTDVLLGKERLKIKHQT